MLNLILDLKLNQKKTKRPLAQTRSNTSKSLGKKTGFQPSKTIGNLKDLKDKDCSIF